MDEVVEALEKYQGLVPLVYDAETMALKEARPQDMYYAVYLKREADKVIAEKDQRIKELTPHWVRLSDELPTTYGPHLIIFQNGKGGCLPFNLEAKSFQVAEPVQWWADAKYIFGDWTAEK